MTNLKITSLNGEWMNNWFKREGDITVFKPTFQQLGSPLVFNTDKTATKLSKLIKNIDSDIYGIQEGPSDKDEMLLFISSYLNDKYSCEIGLDGSSQKIYVLYKKSFFDVTPLTHSYSDWKFDNDGDYLPEDANFARTPVEAKFAKDGHEIRIIVTHFKSLFINQGDQMWSSPDPEQKKKFIQLSLKNRRRITMEAVELRKYVDDTLNLYPKSIIMGDVNDGPGREFFESFMLGMDITSELLGSTYHPENIFSYLLDLSNDYTAIFDDFVDNVPNRHVLLDRILISPSLNPYVSNCKVEYEKYDALVDEPDRRDGRPTDHRPVTLSLGLN
jgi:endonuclease/exonuclease/phosphatase family metal-dependent hydrolase